MRFSGFIVRTNRHGRINLPLSIRKQLKVGPKDEVTFTIRKNTIILKKSKLHCIVTGSTENVIEVFPGVPLSREGMKILLKELKHFNS